MKGGVNVDAYFGELGAQYCRYLKFGERTLTAKERNWLDKISANAQDELFDSTRTRKRHLIKRADGVEEVDQIGMLYELRQNLNDDGECAIVLWAFVFLMVMEIGGAALFPILAWRAGNRGILIMILMAMTGLVLGSLIAIGIALPIIRLYDYCQRRRIALLIAKILVIEWTFDVELIDAETFFNVEVGASADE